jgi:putative ATPase
MPETPLAEILRPKNLTGYIGQEHLVGEGAVLFESIQSGHIPSMIFWGPPGTGKTTLAHIIAIQLGRPFFELSAINSGVRDIRAAIEAAGENLKGAILFIDEIHRFSKSQQDSLLGAVEKGTITLIGATTENPSFEVITPLLSRCQVYILRALEKEHLLKLIDLAIEYYSQSGIIIDIKQNDALLRISGGDARKLYNAIELLVNQGKKENSTVLITNESTLKAIQQNLANYDKAGEQHYDIISAFIKSLRGSDPNASVYWLARMVEGGEDPLFIARRMLILAAEDIGNANPNALLLANACFDAVNKIGWPESRIILSQTAIYLATSPKSNASYMAIEKALETVKKTGDLPVPLPLRNSPTRLMKEIGYGGGYKYAHDFIGNFAQMDFLPDALLKTILYNPGINSRENEIRERLKVLWKGKYDYQ